MISLWANFCWCNKFLEKNFLSADVSKKLRNNVVSGENNTKYVIVYNYTAYLGKMYQPNINW